MKGKVNISIYLNELLEQGEGIIFPYSEIYQEAHQHFAQKMWPAKRRRREVAYNRWKFRGPLNGPVQGLLLAVLDGQVAGQLGLIPVTLLIKDQIYPAQWACDLMVDPSLRRKGLGSLLLAAGMQRNVVTLGSNPSQAADLTMTKLGFQPLPGPHSMFLPINPAQALGWKVPERFQSWIPLLARFLRPLVNLRAQTLASQKSTDSARLVDWSDAAILLQQKIDAPHIVHDGTFHDWRCAGLTGYSPRLQAFITPAGAAAIIQSTSSYYYVYEWVASNFVEAKRLFAAIFRHAVLQGSQTITVLANQPMEQAFLASLGFLKMRTPVKVIYYPPSPLNQELSFHYTLYDSDGNL